MQTFTLNTYSHDDSQDEFIAHEKINQQWLAEIEQWETECKNLKHIQITPTDQIMDKIFATLHMANDIIVL